MVENSAFKLFLAWLSTARESSLEQTDPATVMASRVIVQPSSGDNQTVSV